MEISASSKRNGDNYLSFISKKQKFQRRIFCYLRCLDSQPKASSGNLKGSLICLKSGKLYTFGRRKCCDFVFGNSLISKEHCQIFFDESEGKVYVTDGYVTNSSFDFKVMLQKAGHDGSLEAKMTTSNTKVSLNGVYVNGHRIKEGLIRQVVVDDEISLTHGLGVRFIVEKINCWEKSEDKCSAEGHNCSPIEDQIASEMPVTTGMLVLRTIRVQKKAVRKNTAAKALVLLNKLRYILHSKDPIYCIQRCLNMDKENIAHLGQTCPAHLKMSGFGGSVNERIRPQQDCFDHPACTDAYNQVYGQSSAQVSNCSPTYLKRNEVPGCCLGTVQNEETSKNCLKASSGLIQAVCASSDLYQEVHVVKKETSSMVGFPDQQGSFVKSKLADCERKEALFLNRLETMDGQFHSATVSLPELLYPVNTLTGIFVATFTKDILWFLLSCEVPNLLPITISCHDQERCWDADAEKRISTPLSDYPNLVVVYPLFPDVIAFNKDRKNQGVACHHPKLLLLQRDCSIRVIITSANLVPKQWNYVTNTVWWQDFPRQTLPDYLPLFAVHTKLRTSSINYHFAAQLAGFVASLLVDVPSQAHWLSALAMYDFRNAAVYLVASVPGIHVRSVPCSDSAKSSFVLGCFHASVVGLSYRFHYSADRDGSRLKALAAFLRTCQVNVHGLSEVMLRRIVDIPADPNAIGVLVCGTGTSSERDVHLGFLPKGVAKWIAPLSDAKIFSFTAFIYPKEALACALGRAISKVQLIVYVSQGPRFSEISEAMQSGLSAAMCSLISSLQRSVGLWRLQEILGQYKWPEHLETDFVYSSSSVGTSVNAPFLATFSAAAGKRSLQCFDSEESDPEWGCWNTSHEIRKPSMSILFPTLERVKNSICGIEASRHMLCLSERTWQRLKAMDIFHDAIPYPCDRIGFPMHVKVARRRFLSNCNSSTFGWVYCGSHNLSAAAWGHPLTIQSDCGSNMRLHICNYELGILFVVPPPNQSAGTDSGSFNLDEIRLPFVLPAPKYRSADRPATMQSMKEAIQILKCVTEVDDLVDEEVSDEEEMLEVAGSVLQEGEEEHVYAENLWSQVDSSDD